MRKLEEAEYTFTIGTEDLSDEKLKEHAEFLREHGWICEDPTLVFGWIPPKKSLRIDDALSAQSAVSLSEMIRKECGL